MHLFFVTVEHLHSFVRELNYMKIHRTAYFTQNISNLFQSDTAIMSMRGFFIITIVRKNTRLTHYKLYPLSYQIAP